MSRTVDHDIGVGDEAGGICAVNADVANDDFDVGIERAETSARGFGLARINIGSGKQDLALKVGETDFVVLNQRDAANTCRRQIMNAAGEPMPPAPISATWPARNFNWPTAPISRSTIWRA